MNELLSICNGLEKSKTHHQAMVLYFTPAWLSSPKGSCSFTGSDFVGSESCRPSWSFSGPAGESTSTRTGIMVSLISDRMHCGNSGKFETKSASSGWHLLCRRNGVIRGASISHSGVCRVLLIIKEKEIANKKLAWKKNYHNKERFYLYKTSLYIPHHLFGCNCLSNSNRGSSKNVTFNHVRGRF
jgi:hypothetical protein